MSGSELFLETSVSMDYNRPNNKNTENLEQIQRVRREGDDNNSFFGTFSRSDSPVSPRVNINSVETICTISWFVTCTLQGSNAELIA
jgi:hypothetical protein